MTDNKFSAVVSDSTLAMYHSNIRTIAKKVGVTDWIKNADWLFANQNEVFKMLEDTENNHTRKNRVSSLLWFAELHPTPAPIIYRLKALQMDCFERLQKGYATQEKNEKQEANWITVEEMDAKIAEMFAKSPKSVANSYIHNIKRIMLLFHRHLPIRNDLRLAKIMTKAKYDALADKSAEFNYLIQDQATHEWIFILNKYKTAGSYGQRILNIPIVVAEKLNEEYSATLKHDVNDEFFYQKKDGTPVSTSQYTNTFNSIFPDKKVGSTQVRRTIVSSVHQPKPNELKAKQDLAFIMQHSVGTAQGVYAKI